MQEVYDLHYKEDEKARKWQKASLSMKDDCSLSAAANELISQEGWHSARITRRSDGKVIQVIEAAGGKPSYDS